MPRSFPKHLAAVLALAALLPVARAGEHHERRAGAAPPPLYQQECGACHVAYPAQLLPAASWQHLMAKLPRHYGSDASLDAAAARDIGAWLAGNAGRGKRAREAPPEDRITRAAWFQREHREVAAADWQRPAIKTPANCSACHGGAAQGDFHEHAVRIPR